jgi:hypothetical protein
MILHRNISTKKKQVSLFKNIQDKHQLTKAIIQLKFELTFPLKSVVTHKLLRDN